MFKKKLGIVRFNNGRTEKIISRETYWDSVMNEYTLVRTKRGKYLCVETHEYTPAPFTNDDQPVIPLRYVYRFFKLDMRLGWMNISEIKNIELFPTKDWTIVTTSKNNKPFVKIKKSKKSKCKGDK